MTIAAYRLLQVGVNSSSTQATTRLATAAIIFNPIVPAVSIGAVLFPNWVKR